jgi:hypothetical protein
MTLGVSTTISKVLLSLWLPSLALTIRRDDRLLYCELGGGRGRTGSGRVVGGSDRVEGRGESEERKDRVSWNKGRWTVR